MAEEEKDKLDLLIERVDFLEHTLREQLTRLYAIERRLGLTYKPKETTRVQQPVEESKPQIVEPPREESKPQTVLPRKEISEIPPEAKKTVAPPIKTPAPPVAPRAATPIRPAPPVRAAEPLKQTQANLSRQDQSAWRDLESRIGGRWLLWIGIIAISFGVAFFLRLAFNEWIGQSGRVAVGVAIGLGFLIGAERLRRRYPIYAYGLSGGGILILYLSGFAAYAMYHLVAQPVAFFYMVAVTATASLLAARYNALPIALLGLIGGFLTPILLSTGVDNQTGLFAYITLLDLGVLALAYSKQWRLLNYLAFISTALMFFGWWNEFYEQEKLWTTIFFLTLLFVIFALVAILYNVVNRQPTLWTDLTLVFLNGVIYFGASYSLMEVDHSSNLGLFAVLVAAFYLALGHFTYKRDREDRLLLYTFLGLAFLFMALAVPIQFDQHWVTMGWAMEGAVMTWIGLRVNDRTSRSAGLILFGVALSHWLWIDVYEFAYRAGETFTPLVNRRALSCAVMIVSLAVAGWLYKTSDCELEDQERDMFRSLYALGANALAVALLTMDANSYFDQKKAIEGADVASLSNSKQLTLSLLWAVYGAMALIVGIARRLKLLRAASLLMFAATTIKVLFIDLQYYNARSHSTIFNQTFAAFAILIAALAASAWFYARSTDIDKDEKSLAFSVLVAAANLLAVIALSAEALGHFERAKSALDFQQAGFSWEKIARLNNAKQLALTAVWTVYGTTALLIGIFRRSRPLRLSALGLLMIAAGKVLAVDLQFAKAQWHHFMLNETFGAFALVTAALALGAWLYSRAEGITDRERVAVVSSLVCIANLLALVSLSAETIYYFERAQTAVIDHAMAEARRLENSKQFYLSALWAVYGAGAMAAGILRGLKALRVGALSLLALATAKALLFDLRYSTAQWHAPVFNETFGAFALLIAAMAVSVWFYSREKRIDEGERRLIIGAMTFVGNVLAIIALSAEANGYFQAKMNALVDSKSEMSDLQLARQLSLSMVWAVYGGGMLAFGIMRRNRLLRVMALALTGMTIVKVFLLDLQSLERIYRVIAFIVLGVILLLGAFLYQRLMRLAREEKERAEESATTSTEVISVDGESL
jgi:uncharacterized membrane protein